MCYQASTAPPSELRQRLYEEEHDLQDQFDMTPFHVLLSSAKPRQDLFEVLLDSCPYYMLSRKDCNGKLPMNYLISNWTEENKLLLQMAFQCWIFSRLKPWGAPPFWRGNMMTRISALLNEERKDHRNTLWTRIYTTMETIRKKGIQCTVGDGTVEEEIGEC